MMDPLKPEPSLLSKIGSIAVHTDEFLSPNGHHFDADAIKALLRDAEVVEWLAEMGKMALIPKKRNE